MQLNLIYPVLLTLKGASFELLIRVEAIFALFLTIYFNFHTHPPDNYPPHLTPSSVHTHTPTYTPSPSPLVNTYL